MSEKIHVSVIVPAHNEEKYVKRCIDSIKESASAFKGNVEIIVVCNRCTDATEHIARENGARVLFNEERCIAKVRNTGIEAARGQMVMTIDCDNRMTKGTIAEAYKLLRSGKYIGGGAPICFERYSFPLWCNDLMCRAGFAVTGLYSGIFWAKRSTFTAIGGFVEKKAMEDVEKGSGRNIPTHLQSPLFKGYKYPHDYPAHYVKQTYLPEDLKGRQYYRYGENKNEDAARQYAERIKK